MDQIRIHFNLRRRSFVDALVLFPTRLLSFSTVCLVMFAFSSVATGQSAIRPRAGNEQRSTDKNPVLPPKWAFGVLFGSYSDQNQLLDAMQKLRNGYCGDLLWVDSSWLSPNYNNAADKYICFKFDPGQFPDHKGMISTLHENHFKFGLWEWPYIDKSITELYEYGETNRLFITDQAGGKGKVVNGGGWHGVKFTGQFDFTNPAAAAWFKQLNQPLLDMGMDFMKIDTYSTVAKNGVLFDGSGTDNLRRLYHKTVYEITQSASGGRGFYLAHRMGCTDNDQYPGMWTGDTKTSWTGFLDDMSRAAVMNTKETAAYWCGDTGGYNGDVEGDELYIRWLQYGCFTPITEFFSAKQAKTRFPWKFGPEAQEIFKTYTKLRYRLLPFRYSNAQICYHETPVKYPVRFVPGRKDEIIVGGGDSEMLVAPIHDQGATSGEAHLPAGKKWINYWTGEVYPGGTVPTVSAPLDKVPLFVKAGSIIPMGPEMEYVDQKPADPLTLDIYPSGSSGYTLYEDDGQSNDYQSGGYAKTLLSCDDGGENLVVEIGAAAGKYKGKLEKRTYILKINANASSPLGISKNGAPMADISTKAAFDSASEGFFNDAQASIIWVKFTASTSAATKVVLSGLKTAH